MKNPLRRKKDTGPTYSVDVVSRETFTLLDVGDIHNKRRVVDAFFDSEGGAYGVVTIAVKQA